MTEGLANLNFQVVLCTNANKMNLGEFFPTTSRTPYGSFFKHEGIFYDLALVPQGEGYKNHNLWAEK